MMRLDFKPILKTHIYTGLLLLLGFSLIQTTHAQEVTSFTLVDATTDADLFELADGDTIDLREVGLALNVRANTSGSVEEIRFTIDGEAVRTEKTAPYALFGDTDGDYNAWQFLPDTYQIEAQPYAGGNTTGTSLSISIVVIDGNEPTGGGGNPSDPGTGAVSISGELKKWHKVTLSFDGPYHEETDTDPNPFLDYRLEVTFRQGDRVFQVPGYFAADGQASETGADGGNVWRVHFAPETTGEWSYEVSFRQGANVAVSDDADAGVAFAPLDGQQGFFTINNSDKSGRDFRAKGRLQYVGKHHLQFAETGEYFLKGGPDAPENFLAYEDFDNTPDNGNRRKSWAPHADDWTDGDPSWQNGKGTEIIGALNYLASKGINAFSFLTFSYKGDDKNVYPHVAPPDYQHFDCSKLDQWEVVFSHADQLGLYLHFKTQETENDQELDGGNLGLERRLYYRELIARFSHHLALNWNLGEENTQTDVQRRQMAAYFAEHDPYRHHIVIHTYPGQQEQVYTPLLGTQSELTGASVQTGWNKVHNDTEKWVKKSTESGKPWVVANDEQGNANHGVPPDIGFPGYDGSSPTMHDIRQQTLWGNLMAGGAGVEYYFGYQLPHSDLTGQNYRSRDQSWDYVRHALTFFQTYLPFADMQPSDNLASNGWCLADVGTIYALYLPEGGTTQLELPEGMPFRVQWYNPRNGGGLQTGSVQQVEGSSATEIGDPPTDPSEDWVVLVTMADLQTNEPPVAVLQADKTSGEAPLEVAFDASGSSDADGTIADYSWNFSDGTTGSGSQVSHTFADTGRFVVQLTVTDNEGASSTAEQEIVVTQPAPPPPPTGPCMETVTLMAASFDYANTNFTLDTDTGNELLALDPSKSRMGEVSRLFGADGCIYDLTLHGAGEQAGQSRYKLLINDHFLAEVEMPVTTEPVALGQAFTATFRNIPLKASDKITVIGFANSKDGQQFTKARWLKIDCVPVGMRSEEDCSDNNGGNANQLQEINGLMVAEMERNNLIENWQLKTSGIDFTGTGAIYWDGSQSLQNPGNGVMTYPVKINNPGTYRFEWRVAVGKGNQTSEHNDTWLKIEADDFFGQQGDHIVRPRSQCESDPNADCPNGSSKDGFFKIYGGKINQFEWKAYTSDNDAHRIFATFNEPGTYDIIISARSSHQIIDRMVLYNEDLVRRGDAIDPDQPETRGSVVDCNDPPSNSSKAKVVFVIGTGRNPIANATINLGGLEIQTDAEGRAEFTGLIPSPYSYSVKASGYLPLASSVDISRDMTVLLTLQSAGGGAPEISLSDPTVTCNEVVSTATISASLTLTGDFDEVVATRLKVGTGETVEVSDRIQLMNDGTYLLEDFSLPGNEADYRYTLNLIKDGQTIATANFEATVPCSPATSVEDAEAASIQLRLYPNPTAGNTNLEIQGATSGQLRLLSLDGRLLWQQELAGPRQEIPTADLPTGIYLVEWTDSAHRLIERIQVQ